MNVHPIVFNDLVTLRPLNSLGALHEPDFTIQVVPHYSADAEQGRVSAEAPLGRAVMRRHTGDVVTIRVQDHAMSMRIMAVVKPPKPE